MVKIGVLGLQGGVREHVKSVEASVAEAVVVKRIEQIEEIDGLSLPGGESTTMRRLIDKYDFMEPLRTVAKSGNTMLGTCAGMILLAKTLIGYDEAHIGSMDITVKRNAFGRPTDSFEAVLSIK
ncbi:pyridoxal 5'-phosphate synthase glutaminase subunit PdxT, partial [Bacillus sp. S1-R5C1-FB]|uniref:pyridoxal 5'-phosphate synthase glutaminase subunit PdxT n=1 Tax=Bacillus sp. S1-R5C1-FB TaxID=1973491 RepID=UPI000B4934D3